MASTSKTRTGGLLSDEQLLRLLIESDAELSDIDDDLEVRDNHADVVEDVQDDNAEHSDHVSEGDATPALEQFRELKWKAVRMPVPDLPADEVLQPDSDNEKGILDAMLEYLPQHFWESCAENTNLYSMQQRDLKSVNTSAEELMNFVGIHLIMGALGYPQIKLYWQQDTAVSIIKNCMTRDRFYELRHYLHFVDSEGDHDSDDRLWRVRTFLDCIREKCLSLPRNFHLSLDEQMIPFTGRCVFRQFVPKKPIPVGLKSFVLAAPDGLVLDFRIYTGKGTVSDDDLKKFGLGASIVKVLTESVPQDSTRCIYTDRFFTSIKCLDHLLQRNIFLTGTVMHNRVGKVIKKVKPDKEMSRGDWDEMVREDEKACLVKWLDNKSVLMLSSLTGSEPEQTCQRWSRDEKKKIVVQQPNVVKLYNEKMGGVDLCDRFMSYYRVNIRTRKWPVRMFNHFVDLVVVNCWVMYRRWCDSNGVTNKNKLSLMDYKLHLGKAMINYTKVAVRGRGRPRSLENSLCDLDVSLSESNPKKPRKVVPHPIPEARFDNVGHIAEFVEAKNASKCRRPNCTSKSRIKCSKCDVYLCVMRSNCFTLYHKK